MHEPEGFSLIEMMMALILLTIGLLSSGQLFCYAVGIESLSRSKGMAAAAVQDMLETLSNRYQHSPEAEMVSPGDHGPVQKLVTNPTNGKVVNCFNLTWTVRPVSDPRTGKLPGAVHVRVTAVPATTDALENRHVSLNKQISVSTIFSTRWK
jgi:prepilin-type N-terminal cleavage/methylation domain-containing protein